MGVRLVIHNAFSNEKDYTGTHNHDELIHRDLVDSHPIYAITGLQSVLNTIELEIISINEILTRQNQELRQYVDDNISQTTNYITNYIDDQVGAVNTRIDNISVINDFEDTETIDFDYDNQNKILRSNVKIFNDPNHNNALVATENGLFTPKIVANDTNSVKWSYESYNDSLRELFDNGLRFSHDHSSYSNVFDISECNSWIWDNTLQSFVQPNNTNTYNGFVSTSLFDEYKHTVRLISTDSDNDVNGVIIGLVFDTENHPHTLSALIQRDGNIRLSYKFAIVFDYDLPGETLISNYNLINSNGGWNSYNSTGITLYITKSKNLVTVSASAWGYSNSITNINAAQSIPFEHTFNINLNNYSWGHFFTGHVRYGYSNLSQPNSYFDHTYFKSESKTDTLYLDANVKISNTANNSLQINSDGLYVKQFLISAEARNALQSKSDGYYVQTFNVSTNRLNGLYDAGSGYYYVHKSHSFIDVTQSNHGFIVGDFIYYDNRTSSYKKAVAIDDFDINIVGMVSYVSSTSKFEYVCSGFVSTNLFNESNGYIQGMPLYISADDPGKVTQEQPDISKAVGYPVSNSGIIISIERGIQYNQEANIGDFKHSTNTYNIRSDGFIRIAEGVNYKQTLIRQLLNTVSEDFKDNYIVFNNSNGTISFKNVDNLKIENGCSAGVQLFIKAF